VNKNHPDLLITRFTHGSAGKFLSTVLQTSERVDHWDLFVQQCKEDNNFFHDVTVEYCKRKFPQDHSLHILNEPMVPYCTDLYSTSYPRGNNVTMEQYASQVDYRTSLSVEKNIITNLIFNKPQLPLFCQNQKVVTILVTTEQEIEWLRNTLWSKHFITKKDKIIYTPSHLDYCSLQSIPKLLNYSAISEFNVEDKQKIYNKYVVENHTLEWYLNKNNFVEFDNKNNLNNFFINLHDFFNTSSFIKAIYEVFNHFNLGKIDKFLIEKMHKLWWDRQHQP